MKKPCHEKFLEPSGGDYFFRSLLIIGIFLLSPLLVAGIIALAVAGCKGFSYPKERRKL